MAACFSASFGPSVSDAQTKDGWFEGNAEGAMRTTLRRGRLKWTAAVRRETRHPLRSNPMKRKMQRKMKRNVYGVYSFGTGRIEFNHAGVEVYSGNERIAFMYWNAFLAMCETNANTFMNAAQRRRCASRQAA
jgi:hypothetical protein